MPPDSATGNQTLPNEQVRVLKDVSGTWPTVLGRPAFGRDGRVEVTECALREEVLAFLGGDWASLPFFTRGNVLWMTVAPTSPLLQRAVELVRAWILPSYGWEDEKQPYVAPGEEGARLSDTILSVSKSGYYRWWTTPESCDVTIRKLRQMRKVLARRPEHVSETVPSLLELRQQFSIALLTGDRMAAEAAVASIDRHQLDTAINTHLMRLRLRDQFRDHSRIVEDPSLETLLRARIPNSARLAIIRAFYYVMIAPIEETGDVDKAAATYVSAAHDTIGGLLRYCTPDDGVQVARCLGYRAWHVGDVEAAQKLMNVGDQFLLPLLTAIVETHPVSPAGRESAGQQLYEALSREDVRRVQELGLELILGGSDAIPTMLGADLPRILWKTLGARPNERLRKVLEGIGDTAAEDDLVEVPDTWQGLLRRIRDRDWEAARQFLFSTERPGLEEMVGNEFAAVVETLEELLTDPTLRDEPEGNRVIAQGLPVFVEEFVSEGRFPRPHLTQLYMQLFRLWADVRRGSTFPPDGHVLLVLASAILERSGTGQREVADTLREWWEARKVRALVPYALEAIDLVIEQTSEAGTAQNLWIDAAYLIRNDLEELPPTERMLWRRAGLRAGMDAGAVAELLGPEPTLEQEERDPVADAGLTKVAIVSLHERAAQEAKDLIQERTGADVIIVAETSAGSSTRSAQSADVILFVWSAAKHAVYRAFDSVRDRLEYVQGTGAGSIVLALERWATRELQRSL